MIRKSNPSTHTQRKKENHVCTHTPGISIKIQFVIFFFLLSSSERNTPQQPNNTRERERHPELMVRETRPALGNVHVHKSLIKGRIVASEKKEIRKT
jgi:hypothetical protein